LRNPLSKTVPYSLCKPTRIKRELPNVSSIQREVLRASSSSGTKRRLLLSSSTLGRKAAKKSVIIVITATIIQGRLKKVSIMVIIAKIQVFVKGGSNNEKCSYRLGLYPCLYYN
jgi:hypothetical protein